MSSKCRSKGGAQVNVGTGVRLGKVEARFLGVLGVLGLRKITCQRDAALGS